MLRKVKHIGRKASKYQYVICINQVDVKGTKSWQPYKLVVILSRRKKKVSANAQSWRPSLQNPYLGTASWSGFNQKPLQLNVTLFEDQSFNGFECKNWVFVIENESKDGKRKPIATLRVDLAQYASIAQPHSIELRLKPLTNKVQSVKLNCNISSVFLSAGPATEADALSMTGSTASEDTVRLADIDIANVRDLDSDNSRGSSFISETNEQNSVTQQFESLANKIESLNRSDDNQEFNVGNALMSRDSDRSSLISNRSERAAISPSHHRHRRSSSNGASNVEENSSQSHKRSSSSSDASLSSNSFQRRRLRPSVDFLPSAANEEFPSQSSPAPGMQKSLLRWCQTATAGHEGVKVTNFTTSWRNGRALCALLHHYKPDFVNFENLGRDGRINIKTALDGFEKAGVSNPYLQHPASVADKNSLISILMSIRVHFNDQNGGSDAESEVRNPLPFIYHKQLTPSHVIHSATKLKLLSDLEEKQIEDDVFSTALDQALELSKSPTKNEEQNTANNFSSVKSNNLPATKRPETTTVEALPVVTVDLPLEVVLEEPILDLPETSLHNESPSPTKSDPSDIPATGSGTPFLVDNEDKKSPLPIKNDDDDHLNPFLHSTPKETDLFPSLQRVNDIGLIATVNGVDDEAEDTLPSSCSTPSSPIRAGFDQENASSKVHDEQASPLDVVTETSMSTKRQIQESSNENFQSAVDKLVKSSAERNRKARALKIIAQTKAEMSSEPASSFTDEERKRREKVRERAQELINQTWASLGRDKILNEVVNPSTEYVENSSDKKIYDPQDSPLAFSPISMVNPTCSTPEEPFEIESDQNEVLLSSSPVHLKESINSNSPYSSPTVTSNDDIQHELSACDISSASKLFLPSNGTHKQKNSLALDIDQKSPSSSSEISEITHSPSFDKNEEAVSSTSPHTAEVNRFSLLNGEVVLKNEETNSCLSSIPNKEPSPVKTTENHSSSSLTGNLNHPLKNSLQNPFEENSNSFTSCENSHPLASPVYSPSTSPCKQESRSVLCNDDVEKRWSSMVEKTSTSPVISTINVLEKERLTLEIEQRNVEERANEVQHELQELKGASGRVNKRREADLMHEWFQLVNKKNAILRQQDQLSLKEEEQAVLVRVEKIHEELIPLMTIEESMKTFAQKERETELLEEKVRLVNERDRLVCLINEKEKTALDEEELLQVNLGENMTKVIQGDDKCLIM